MRHQYLVEKWIEATKTLSLAKKEEIRLRNLILPRMLKDKISGSITDTFGGYKLSATARLNYTIDSAELAILHDELSEEELACVKYDPTLRIANFNKLPEHNKLSLAVTIKPGQGSLALK